MSMRKPVDIVCAFINVEAAYFLRHSPNESYIAQNILELTIQALKHMMAQHELRDRTVRSAMDIVQQEQEELDKKLGRPSYSDVLDLASRRVCELAVILVNQFDNKAMNALIQLLEAKV